MKIDLPAKIKHLERTAKAFFSLSVPNKVGTYIEIGAHRGRSIVTIGGLLKDRVNQLHIVGYDIFDAETPQFHIVEDNGKGAGNIIKCNKILGKLAKRNPNVTYELIAGYTTDTLTERKAEWAYIDGGHSYETVKWDHQKLKESNVIVFDDADLEGVNRYLWEIKDQYKLYDLHYVKGGARQVAIINDLENYNFNTAELRDFEGVNPDTWRPQR